MGGGDAPEEVGSQPQDRQGLGNAAREVTLATPLNLLRAKQKEDGRREPRTRGRAVPGLEPVVSMAREGVVPSPSGASFPKGRRG